MFDTVFGVPAHALVVHAVVVFVPLAALAGLLVALWPAARVRYAPVALVITTIALLGVPVATESGEKLEERVGGGGSELIEKHTELGENLLPFVAGLWLGTAALVWLWWSARRDPEGVRGGRSGRAGILVIIAAVVVVLTAIGSGVQVVRIGHSGAEAVWSGVVSNTPGSGE